MKTSFAMIFVGFSIFIPTVLSPSNKIYKLYHKMKKNKRRNLRNKWGLFFLSVITFIFCSCVNENKISNSYNNTITKKDSIQLRYLKELEWPKAYAEQDTILLDRILGDDFEMITHTGTYYTKKDELAWIKKNATQNDSFYYEIKRFDFIDTNTVLICGTGNILQDSSKSVYQSSNVFVRRNNIWKAVLSHVSGIKEVND